MKIHFLQTARAIAAWLVVTDHALLELSRNAPDSQITHLAWSLGGVGVYLFFVISGFVMVHISWESFGKRAASADFLLRRIIRIVPLYWLATFAAFASHKVLATHGAHAGWMDLAYSLTFIPYLSGEDGWYPILPAGWTLNYEMTFYVVFALGLTLPRKLALPAVGAALGGFIIVGPYFAKGAVAYLASPIVLWFLLGMGLAVIWHRREFAEPAWIAKSAKLLELFGDASYSTYLVHGLTLTVFLRIWIMAAGSPSVWIVPASLVVVTIAGLTTYMLVERPVLRFITKFWSPKRVVHSLNWLRALGRVIILAPSRRADDGPGAPPINVLVLCPGGLEHGGGIGRQMGYFLAALPRAAEAPAYRVIDTRGPWFLGSARWRISVSALYLVAAAFGIAWAGIVGRPSLLHVNITGRGSTSRKLVLTAVARAVALPYVLHIHDYEYDVDVRARGGLMRRLVRGMFAAAAQIIVLGTEADRTLRAALALPDAPILVLPNAVPDPQPAPRAAATMPAADPVHLVFLGYLSARKGVPELLEALASPALAALQWRATLAGGGPVDEFRARAAALGLANRVTFPGWIDQPAASALCAAADILVLPSHAEGLAMSVLEGLAHGLAVVATPVGAHAEVIEPDQSGLLAPPGDVAALAAALIRVIGDPTLRERLRAGARQRFLGRFDVRSYSVRLARLHVGLLGGRSLVGRIETEPQS
jgi:glycosyltransferase involved in cell wall biosynthesis/peptidoglycan/LPS O-acetylase OafA/YrhL